MIARTSAFLFLAAVSSAAAAQTHDHAPVALQSSGKMEQAEPGSESWTYIKPGLSLAKYDSLLIQPTAVYAGPDAQFGAIPPPEREKYAGIVTTALQGQLAQVFPLVEKATARTIVLRVTLLGAQPTRGGVATATRLTTFGIATSAIKSVRGKPGTMTGSVLFAVEVFDGVSNELLAAAVRREHPDALDIPATLSTTDTVKAVARDFADQLRERLEAAKVAG